MEAQLQPSRPIRSKLVCEKNVFCYRDVRSYGRLIIQNRFYLLLKYFSIRNSLSDVPSAPLFVDAVSIFVACAVEFQVGVLAPENFSVSNLPLRGFGVLVFAVLFAREMARDSPIVNIVLQPIKRQLFMNTLVIESLQSNVA